MRVLSHERPDPESLNCELDRTIGLVTVNQLAAVAARRDVRDSDGELDAAGARHGWGGVTGET
jgi:hypothetical protein